MMGDVGPKGFVGPPVSNTQSLESFSVHSITWRHA